MLKAPEFVVTIIKQYWQPGQKILDIGCGPGFLREVFHEDYIGSDITAEPYSSTIDRNVDIVCPSDNLLVSSNSIDIVIMKSVFFLLNNHDASLKEAMRVLKPGGKIIIFDYNKKTQKELQSKEGHDRYPCWTQWGLKKLLKQHKFIKTTSLIASSEQPFWPLNVYHLLRQEIFGTWAIVCGTKI